MRKLLVLLLIVFLVFFSTTIIPTFTSNLMCDPWDDSDDGGGFTDSVEPKPLADVIMPLTSCVT